MSDFTPKFWHSYKGRILETITLSGEQTWEELQEHTGFSPEILNTILSELYSLEILYKTEENTYRIIYDVFSEYRDYLNELDNKLSIPEENEFEVGPKKVIDEKILRNINQEDSNEFSRLLSQKIEEFLTKKNIKEISVQKSLKSPDNQNSQNEVSKLDFQSETFNNVLKHELKKMDYKFIQFYKKGGSAYLFLVFNSLTEQNLIFKIYTQSDKEIQDKYLIYDKKIAPLNHPNINNTINTGLLPYEGVDYRWSTQKHIPNSESLDNIKENLIKNKKLEERLSLVNQLIDGIVEFRNSYHTHNDLHSGNILLKNDETKLIIIDPGFSKIESGREDTDLDDIKKILREYFFSKKEQNNKYSGLFNSNTFYEMKEFIPKFSSQTPLEKEIVTYYEYFKNFLMILGEIKQKGEKEVPRSLEFKLNRLIDRKDILPYWLNVSITEITHPASDIYPTANFINFLFNVDDPVEMNYSVRVSYNGDFPSSPSIEYRKNDESSIDIFMFQRELLEKIRDYILATHKIAIDNK